MGGGGIGSEVGGGLTGGGCSGLWGADGRGGITILGIDEADSLKGEVTWISPIARALLKARGGDVVKLVTPVGVQEIEVLSVHYPKASQ